MYVEILIEMVLHIPAANRTVRMMETSFLSNAGTKE